MKNIVFRFLIVSVVCFFSIQQSFAWVGLVAQTGDILNTTKWNEMITELNQKIESSNIIAGTGISVTASGTDVTISSTSSGGDPTPYVSPGQNFSMLPSSTSTLSIEGTNFTPTSTVSIPSWAGSINSITVHSPTSMDINITSGTALGTYDIVINNGGSSNTAWSGNGQDMIEVNSVVWNDLRLGGTNFTHGNAAGNDIRYKAGMTLGRDANGMYFDGLNPWSSWVKFESLGWTRGSGKTLEWVLTTPTSSMMIGIGSDATNETSTAQYVQAEVEAYFQSSTTMWGLYGNSGTVGATANQGNSTSISGCASGTYKVRFTDDGNLGSGIFTLYCLPSAAQSDWDDTSSVLNTFAIGGTLNPNETNIMPFIIPRSASAQRFIAVKVD